MARASRAVRWLAVMLLAVLLLVPLDARAQGIPQPPAGAPNAADGATAKRNFEEGLKLFGEGAFAEALAKFERSYALGGRPSALRNIAQCHRSLRHFVEAYEAYDQLIALHDAQLTPPDKAAVKQALSELGELSGTVAIDASESDAEIFVDDKSVGKSPQAKPKRVVLGVHKIRVTKAGFEPFETDVKVEPLDQKKITAKLDTEKRTGRLAVREPNGREVRVYVDGDDKGAAPWEGDVAEGEHTVEAKSAKFGSEKRTVKIVRKEKLEVSLDAKSLLGRLRITTLPASAGIILDDVPVGTGAFEGEVAPGKHTIKVAVAGQQPVTREVTISAGETIAQEIPVVTAVGALPPDFRGLYVRLTVQPSFAAHSLPDNSVAGRTSLDGGGGVGVGGAVRIGWSLDPVSIEVVGAFMADFRSQSIRLNQPPASGGQSNYDLRINGPNGFFGVGPRITSRDDSTRLTFGIAPGLAFRSFHAEFNSGDKGPTPTGGSACGGLGQPPCGGGSTASGGSNDLRAGYTGFGMIMDGGVLFGSTPGAKFFLGLHAWLDFPAGDIVVGPDKSGNLPAYASPGNGLILANSVQFYGGPTLGIQFGR